MASRTRVRVHNAAIRSLWLPGGRVHRFTGRFARSAEYQSRIAAPKRTGALRRSIDSDRRGSNQYGNKVTVWTTAEHAKWVLLGTKGKRMPKGRFIQLYKPPRPVAAARGRQPTRGKVGDFTDTMGALVKGVAGQSKNNFLDRGMNRALRIHGLR